MAKNTINDLNYGHLGLATYRLNSHSWSFGRHFGQHGHLKLLGSIDSVIPSPNPPAKAWTPHSRSAKSRDRACADLIRQNSDLSAANITSISHNGLISEEAEILSKTSNKSGELFAFGLVPDTASAKKDSNVEVVAFASGDCRSILKLTSVDLYARGWNDSRQVWLSTPEISAVELSQWDFNGAQIEQIVFANPPGNKGTFLAVRTRLQTTVFRPRYRAFGVPSLQPSSRGSQFDPSNLDLNPIVTFSIQATDGHPHAYIAFNPWYPRSFGIVTEQGSWYTWELEGKAGQRNTYTSNRTAQGSLLDYSPVGTDDKVKLIADLWAHFSWVIDVNIIAVCCRKRLSVFDITGRSKPLTCDGIISVNGPDWILDVKRDPLQDHQLIILTSTQLLLLSILRTGQSTNPILNYRGVLSWRHFRNEEDTAMSLSLTPDGQDLIILISSQLNSNVTMFRVSSEGVLPIASSKADPTMLSLSGESNDLLTDESNEPDRPGILQMVVESLEFRTRRKGEECQAMQYAESDKRFFQAFILRKDLEIQKCLLYCEDLPSGNQSSTIPDLSVVPPQWKRRLRKYGKSSARVLDDFFVVGNDHETMLSEAFRPYKAPRWDENMLRKTRTTEISIPRPILQSGKIRQSAEMFVDTLNATDGENSHDFPVTVAQFEKLIENHAKAEGELPQTLFRIVKPHTHIRDINKEAHALEGIIQHFHDSQVQEGKSTVLRRISHHNTLPGNGSSDYPLAVDDIFDRMLSLWLSPLPPELNLQRVAKERLIRQATAELSLSSAVMRPRESFPTEGIASHDQGMGQTGQTGQSEEMASIEGLGMPSASQSSHMSSHSSATIRESNHAVGALPTPETTPSIASTSTYPLTASGLGDVYSRLARYTHVQQKTILPSPLLQHTLSHWSIGEDPATYDHESALRRIINAHDEEENQSRRKKLDRKVQRHLERQRRKATSGNLASSQVSQPMQDSHEMVVRSSPGLAGQDSKGTGTQMSSQILPASQVERGLHGGRKPKRQKSRRQGF